MAAGHKIIGSLFILLLFAALTPASAVDDITTETSISWDSGDIIISATAPIPPSVTNITTARFRITEIIDRNLTSIVTDAFELIYLDSMNTLSEGFSSDSRIMREFDDLNLSKNRISSSMSLKLDSVTNIYRYNIYSELIPILDVHTRTMPAPVELNYEPTATFSGIVIYAADELPLYGENRKGMLNPAVFPKIYNEDMELTASPGMSDPAFLSKWGFVLYTDSLDEKEYEHRIGLYPYRITAKAIFGNNRTDVLISDFDASRILFNEDNRRLIREGRIVIILAGS